ncbi:hypothetical protein [uncultured Methanolobus sp.]|uniref:hypothetical protein n=1 Tax=uncultured Methanolobus sp. TaxID=218300 RepID=UPI0029C6F731|nr:hypothetical protein [uncultured Methanolobus sp.]
MSGNENKIESNISKTEKQENLIIVIEFLSKKRNLHWEIHKGIENKAVQLVLFSGVMLGLLINLINLFPNLRGVIRIESFNINYHFLTLGLILYVMSAISGLRVLLDSLF